MSRRLTAAATPYLFLAPFLAVFVAFLVLPAMIALRESFFRLSRSGLGLGEAQARFAGFSNYLDLASDSELLGSFRRVLVYGGLLIPVMLLLAATTALLIDAGAKRLQNIYRLGVFLPYAVPTVVAALIWGFLYNKDYGPAAQLFQASQGSGADPLGPRTVLAAVANVTLWQFTGYNVIIFLSALQAIPGSIYEAARLDGCNELGLAYRIKLPLIRPALVLSGLFSIIGTLQLFGEPFVLQPNAHTIDQSFTPNLYAYYLAFGQTDFNKSAAVSVVTMLLTVVLAAGFIRLTARSSGWRSAR